MSFGAHGDLHSQSLGIALTASLIAVALVYWRGWYYLPSGYPNARRQWRLTAFVSGLFILWIAIASPLARMDHELLTVHMVQHLLIMTVAAPLILLGAPVITLLNGLPRPLVNRVVMPVLRCSSAHKLESTVSHPVSCWLASTAVVIAWHIPALFELALCSGWWHGGEQISFFAAGLLFWWPVVQPWPSATTWPQWTVPLYLFLATLPCDALSAFLTFCGRVVYPNYLNSHQVFSISPLRDQECAGPLMWVWVTFAYLAPAAAVTIRILSPTDVSPKIRILAKGIFGAT